MKIEGRNFRSSILVILIALVLIAQAPLAVFAGQVDDNYDYVEVVDSGDTMNYNGGVIEENDKYLVTEDVEFKAIWEKV